MDSGAGWSDPDAAGVRSRVLPARSALRLRRQRRRMDLDPEAPRLWPAGWREMAIEWVRGKRDRARWERVLGAAGPSRATLAHHVLDALLEAGWIAVDEVRDARGHWSPMSFEWIDRERSAAALGLPDAAALRRDIDAAASTAYRDPRLAALADGLAGRPAALALRRFAILQALDIWLADGRQGTRRQFALAASGDTKGLADADWRWLDESVELSSLGIGVHTPGIWLRAPLRLHLPTGVLDLGSVGDALALTPATLEAVSVVEGAVARWRILENRTSFEQAARARGQVDGVLWLPGFAAPWWRTAAIALMRRAPAPVRIACDPDPAGIRIALAVGAACDAAGLAWRPWRMRAEDLGALTRRKPLGDYDRAELARLDTDPQARCRFAGLIDAMREGGEKGEQEGLDFRP
ncbi:hypothetical protein [Luteimonas terrae]|uniref:DUF2399 domain-containing protein n=1 Tax=Luteimonas terrae TaxID=1530191 RepID=A0ABU1XZ38_9GAMM|nr:hypothetical protein [Luteimonas terrae]MDR7194052.1 hypothetical protein [Luteimonas terrae]